MFFPMQYEPDSGRPYPANILLLDPDTQHVQLVSAAIYYAEPQWTVINATSIQSADICLHQQQLDLIITDLDLPDGNGIELLKLPILSCPVIVMSNHGNERIAVAAIKAGAMDYIVKSPNNLPELPKNIRRILREWRHIKERRSAHAALQCNEARMRSIAANLPGVVMQIFVRCGGEVGVHYVDGRLQEVFGLSKEQDLFSRFLLCIDVRDRQRFQSSIFEAVSNFKPWSFEGRFIKPSGELIWFKARAGVRKVGAETVLDGLLLDNTECKSMEEELRSSEERFRTIVQHAWDTVLILDAQARIDYVSPVSEPMLGYSGSDLCAQSLFSLVHPEDQQMVEDAFIGTLTNHQQSASTIEFRCQHKHGYWVEVEASITNLLKRTELRGILVIIRDISARRQDEERIQHMAHHDPLTGLPNRRRLAEQALLELQAAERSGTEIAVLFCDLDHFKEINDSLGHIVGDLLLIQVSSQIKRSLRDSDILARLGGDEFMVLMPGSGRDGAARVADKIIEVLRKPVLLGEHELRVTCSIGISIYPEHGNTFQELLVNADIAMYQSKQFGRNAFSFYDPTRPATQISTTRKPSNDALD